MIRIDLKEDHLEGGGSNARASKIQILSPVIKRIKRDLPAVLTLAVGLGIAVLFPLFLDQYKTFVRAEHTAKKRQLQTKSDQLKREIEKYTPFRKELESYEQQKKLVSTRLSVVRELLTSRGTPILVLDSVGQYLPKKTWINSIELAFGETQGTLLIAGSSYSNEEIAEYVDRLGDSVHLADVSLGDVNTRIEEKTEVRGFQVGARTREGGLGHRVKQPLPAAQSDATAPAGEKAGEKG